MKYIEKLQVLIFFMIFPCIVSIELSNIKHPKLHLSEEYWIYTAKNIWLVFSNVAATDLCRAYETGRFMIFA